MLLLDKHPAPARKSSVRGKRSKYTSRWKLILSSYNQVRMRLLNSEVLLERTSLHLYTINEFTLVSIAFHALIELFITCTMQLRWFKNTARRDEVKMLMQGLSLPALTMCASSPLPPHRDVQPPPPPTDPIELEDSASTAVENENVGADVVVETVSKSRTTEWRERKRQQLAAGIPGPTKKARRQSCCRVCGQVQSTG